MNNIGCLNEQSLHAQLKSYYAGENGQIEVPVDGYVVDVVKDGTLIEIQTGNFSVIKSKLRSLADKHQLKLVYPIAQQKWLVKESEGEQSVRRKSPKRGKVYDVFAELVSFPDLIIRPNFSLELTLIHEEEVRVYTGKKHWVKNGWETVERRLISVGETLCLADTSDFANLLPDNLPERFTTKDLANTTEIPAWLAQKMAYCLVRMGTIENIGKQGRYNLFQRQIPC